MTKTRKISKAATFLLVLLMIFSAFMTIAPTVYAVDNSPIIIGEDGEGKLTIYKLAQEGLEQSEAEAVLIAEGITSPTSTDLEDNFYFNTADGMYYRYLSGAEYKIYLIGTIDQTSSTTSTTVQYLDVASPNGVIDISALDPAAFNTAGYSPILGNPISTGTDGKIVFTGLDLGLYYVEETTTPSGVANSNNFFVQMPMTTTDSDGNQYWNYDVTAYPKNSSTGTLKKEIIGGTVTDDNGTTDTSDDKETVGLGGIVEYQLTVTTPTDLVTTDSLGNTTLNYTTYQITDKASRHLTVLNGAIINSTTYNIVVSYVDSGGSTVTLNSSDYTVTGPAAGNDPYDSTDTATYNFTTIEINDSVLKAIGNGATITVQYYAQVSNDAAYSAAGKVEIDNESYIEYATDGSTTYKKGPEDNETVYTYSYSVQKVDENNAPLDGAEFALVQYVASTTDLTIVSKTTTGAVIAYYAYDSAANGRGWYLTTDDTDLNIVKVSSADSSNTDYIEGLFAFRGLATGIYYLMETEAPNSYTLLKDTIEITIDSTTTTTANSKDSTPKYDDFTIQIVNKKNASIALPTTGGAGIYMFLIIGAALIITAIVLFVKSRRKNDTSQ